MTSGRITLINGTPVPYEEAKLHVEDRAFQFGESVYEVMFSYRGGIFRRKEHLERLQASADGLAVSLPPLSEIHQAVETARQAAGTGYVVIYIQVTNGELPRAHAPGKDVPPNFIVIAEAAPEPDFDAPLNPITCMSTPDRRWLLCHIKSTNLVLSTIAKKEALAAEFDDAIFVRDDLVTEATASNVFFVSNGVLLTPPADNLILPGITRVSVLDAAANIELGHAEVRIPAPQMFEADEAFLSSTSSGLRPISRIDHRVLGDGGVGPVTQRVARAVADLVVEECAAEAAATSA